MLPHLVRAGHTVHVLVVSADHVDRRVLDIDGVRISYLSSESLDTASRGFDRFRHGFPSFSALLPFAWAAFRQAEGGVGYDLVETTDFPMLYAPWVAENVKVPVNVSLHGSPGQLDWYENAGAGGMDADLMRMVERAAFSSVHSIQANSDANSHFWGGLTRREIPVIPPAIAMSQTTHSRDHNDSQRIPGGLVVGRLQTWKGPRVLCEAMRLLPDLEMRWIGRDVVDPIHREPLSRVLLREYPDVFGKRLHHEPAKPHTEVQTQIANAEFLCVPSNWDVFNLTVVEAMELGTPVICSTAAGAAMLIRHGENGFLFDPKEPSQLATAIHSFQKLDPQERKRIAAAARQTVRERLDPRALSAERIRFYTDLTNSRRIPSPDPWLNAMLSPRGAPGKEFRILESFTSLELLRASGLQLKNGLQWRFQRPRK